MIKEFNKPLYYEGGIIYLNKANISDIFDLSMGKITSSDNKFTVDLDERRIAIMSEEQTSFETENGANYHIFDCDCNEGAFHIEISPDYQWDKDDIWELVNTLLKKIGELDENGEIVEPEEVEKGHDQKLTHGGGFEPYDLIDLSNLHEDFSYHLNQVGENCKNLIEGFKASQEKSVYEEEKKQKPIFVVTYPGFLSEDHIKIVRNNIKKQLDESNIDANPVILSDGMKGYFEKLN